MQGSLYLASSRADFIATEEQVFGVLKLIFARCTNAIAHTLVGSVALCKEPMIQHSPREERHLWGVTNHPKFTSNPIYFQQCGVLTCPNNSSTCDINHPWLAAIYPHSVREESTFVFTHPQPLLAYAFLQLFLLSTQNLLQFGVENDEFSMPNWPIKHSKGIKWESISLQCLEIWGFLDPLVCHEFSQIHSPLSVTWLLRMHNNTICSIESFKGSFPSPKIKLKLCVLVTPSLQLGEKQHSLSSLPGPKLF